MECVGAVCYLLSGSSVLILRHPESVRLTRSFIDLLSNGGSASDIEAISKRLALEEGDLTAISPAPNLDFGAAEAPEPEKKAAKPKAEAKPAPALKKEEKAEAKPEPKAAPPKDPVDVAAENLGIDLEALLKKRGASREDIRHTAEKHGLSIEDVLKKLGG